MEIKKKSWEWWISCVRMPVFFIIVALLCHLRLLGLVLIGIFSGVMVPVLVWQKLKEEDQQLLLEECSFYMEQLIYSFRKHRKILAALRDIAPIIQGRLKLCVESALYDMENHTSDENLFQHGLSKIEEIYQVHLLDTLHAFLIRVEEQGGDCNMALGILLDQLRAWKKSQKEFLRRKKSIQSRLILSVVLSCLICLAVVRMMPVLDTVIASPVYQFCTGAGIMVLQAVYLWFRTIDRKQRKVQQQDDVQIAKMYARLHSSGRGPGYWRCVKTLEQQIQQQFPQWMFDMILRLQTENVQTAINRSLDDAPEVMVRPLYQLSEELQVDPVSIQPYLNFLEEFQLPEIRAVMLQLYAINDMGREDIQEQIGAMLDQNQKMTEVAEELKADNILSGLGMLAAVPMLVSVVVLLVDLTLMLFSFLGEVYIV